MPKISLDTTSESFEITSYNGNFAIGKIHQLTSLPEDIPLAPKWNFFRQGDNHSYVGGNVSYAGDCRNNLIISPYRNNKLINVKNAFICVEDFYVEISPISDICNAINKGKKVLSNQEINYNIPKAVFERENLIEKDENELKDEVKQRYKIKIKEISMISCGRTNNGIYYIRGDDGKEYVLKFRGRDKERAELLSKITQSITSYFPLNFRRKDNGNFTFGIGNELWGLEEFVRKSHQKLRDLRYFSLLGSHIGLLHNNFSNFLKRNKWIKEVLTPAGSCISESNLISFYFDLVTGKTNNTILLSELERIIEKDLDTQMKAFPITLIHGDLNHSNLIWQENNPKIIDSETIKNLSRLNEFESPLLFGENMEKPRYIQGSLEVMIHSYNQSSGISLSKEEIKVLPSLLKYALLRNFVVRKIRRRSKNKSYLGEIIENLKLIDDGS